MQEAKDPREAFVDANSRRTATAVSDDFIGDLKFFEQLAKQGKPVTFKGLREWMLEHHAEDCGRMRMISIAKANGVEPWWK